jgi:hypothetical protein
LALHVLTLDLLARLAPRHPAGRSGSRHVRSRGFETGPATIGTPTVGPSWRAGLLALPAVWTTTLGTPAIGPPPAWWAILVVAARSGLGENEKLLILQAGGVERRCRCAQDRHGHHRAGEQS